MFYGINIAVLWYYVLGSDFFYCHPRFTTNSGGLRNRPKPTYTFDDWKNQVPPDKPALPDISMTVDAFSKSYYSILLSDFGVLDFTNAFATVPGIEYIQSRQDTDLAAAAEEFHFDIADEHLKTGRIAPVLQPGQNPILYNMTAGPTTVYTQYLCSVPKRKSGMSLIFPVLIADIVFLQAVWKLFILITTWWLGRTDKQMNYCAGCLETKRAGDLAVDAFDTRPPHSRRYSERSELQELIPMRSYGR
ncbi:hypothetical protein B0A48_11262 [Cryoendolithus antarcticus]|uniref:Uncharacterized protein n=1 Tax=Cryoendolithus antarcticus TaxID=1507870 RepID=A0A1V8SV76_9PEZI|nr:hypothetical protein B0A48_11262 [Cryoendolithus antarcticus]